MALCSLYACNIIIAVLPKRNYSLTGVIFSLFFYCKPIPSMQCTPQFDILTTMKRQSLYKTIYQLRAWPEKYVNLKITCYTWYVCCCCCCMFLRSQPLYILNCSNNKGKADRLLCLPRCLATASPPTHSWACAIYTDLFTRSSEESD